MDNAHKHVPVPKTETLSSRFTAQLANTMLCAIANMRKPAPATSYPFLKQYGTSNAAANIKPQLSMAHKILRVVSEGTNVPIIPNTQPIKSPVAAVRRINVFFINSFYLIVTGAATKLRRVRRI
jgi:hypothetical protein